MSSSQAQDVRDAASCLDIHLDCSLDRQIRVATGRQEKQGRAASRSLSVSTPSLSVIPVKTEVLVEKTKTREKFHCDICPKQFNDGVFLEKHKATKHPSIKVTDASGKVITAEEVVVDPSAVSFQCDQCDNTFDTANQLSKHKKTHKSDELSCNNCGKHFLDQVKLRKHEKIHTGQGEHECEVCQKRFNTSSSLILHRNIHLPVLPFKCDVCDKQFAQKGNFQTHVKKYHQGVSEISITNHEVKSENVQNESLIVEDSENIEADDEGIIG